MPDGGMMRISAGANILQPWSDKQLQDNANASAFLRANGKRFTQQIYAATITPVFGQQQIVSIPIQPVGLITKFFVEVVTTVTNPAGGSTLTRTGMGPWNSLSLLQYTDPNSNARIATPGWHLANVIMRRHRRIPGAAVTTDAPGGGGATSSPIACPATIAANAAGTVAAVYEVPLAFGRHSLKGAVFSGAVFATQSLQLTFNPSFAKATGTPLDAVYTGSGTGANAPTYSTAITVYQEYWDQFPLQLIPMLSPDLSTVYEIKQTSLASLIVSADNFVRFSNLRQFQSTVLAYDNGGTLNAGTDINYFSLQSANQTTEWKRSPRLQAYLTRNAYGDELPAGFYMFDFSEDPIVTAAEGNTVLSINPSSVSANAVLNIGWEDLGVSSVLASAPSLAGSAS
jgi:P3 major capsid protein